MDRENNPNYVHCGIPYEPCLENRFSIHCPFSPSDGGRQMVVSVGGDPDRPSPRAPLWGVLPDPQAGVQVPAAPPPPPTRRESLHRDALGPPPLPTGRGPLTSTRGTTGRGRSPSTRGTRGIRGRAPWGGTARGGRPHPLEADPGTSNPGRAHSVRIQMRNHPVWRPPFGLEDHGHWPALSSEPSTPTSSGTISSPEPRRGLRSMAAHQPTLPESQYQD